MMNKQKKAIERYEVKGYGKEAHDKRVIQSNLKTMKYPTGQLKTVANREKGMFQLLKTINVLTFYQGNMKIARGNLVLQSSAQDLYRACGKDFVMRYSVQATTNLLHLLCLAGAVKVLSWDDLTREEKARFANCRHTYYRVLDLQKADFSRISKMDYNTKLNYATVATRYGDELAVNMFSDIESKTERQSFDKLGIEHFTNEITNRGVVTLQEAVTLFKKYQPLIDYKEKWFTDSLRALFIMKYFQGRLKLTTYAKSRATGLNVTGNTKVIEPVKSYAVACF